MEPALQRIVARRQATARKATLYQAAMFAEYAAEQHYRNGFHEDAIRAEKDADVFRKRADEIEIEERVCD